MDVYIDLDVEIVKSNSGEKNGYRPFFSNHFLFSKLNLVFKFSRLPPNDVKKNADI